MLNKIFRNGRNRVKKLTKRDISLNRLANFKKEISTDNHKVPLNILCERLNTNVVTGLTSEQARLVLQGTGPNTLTPSTKKSLMARFFKTLTHSFSLLLWVGAFLSYTAALIQYYYTREIDVDDIVLGSVLVAVVLVSGGFMFLQESKSTKILETFVNMVPPKATVIRGGQSILIDSKDVVVGDLVELKSGDRVPADIRIIQSQGLKVDNSSLTGENEPLSRTTQCTNDNIFETKNLAFFSTNALEGTAKGIVVACGDQTVMGRIAGLTARLEKSETPLSKEMRHFMKVIGIWACFLGFLFGIAAFSMSYSWLESAMILIGIIVANVPEGLLATVTVSLTLTAKKMAAKNCIVKNLEAVETLGSTSIICSDKTGTLTQNVMTVHHVWFSKTVARAMAPRNKLNSDYLALMRCAVLCNRAKFEPNQEDVPIQLRKVIGDASEAAILKYTEKVSPFGPSDEYRRKNAKLAEMPFNSTNKYQISIHALQDGSCLAVMKGAPEKILDKCTLILVNGETQEMTTNLFQMCNRACTELAAQGERVLGFCDLALEERYTVTYPFSIEPPNFPMEKFRFLGFMSLIDPPRPQVVNAVSECRAAGIKVIMVTGDHPITARAIAEQVGIITTQDVIDLADYTEKTPLLSNKAIVVQGSTLREMPSKDLERILCYYKEIVFARTSPTQKLHIVEAAQRIGEIVAVTGDGVNDAPALKKADIGISMGIAGSEVSKQSADIILLDDNFASILLGIEEGRKIFDNLKKSIAYVLASNVAEMMPLLAFIVLRIPLPISVVAILCIDLVTDMLPAISLAYEKAESDIMSRPPRDPIRDRLVTFKLYFYAFGHTGMIEAAAGMFVYFAVMAEHGFFPERLIGLRSEWESSDINDLKDSFGQEWSYGERKVLEYTCSTAFLISVVVTQWSDALVCKTRRNSLFKQGMSNNMLNVSLLIETALACFLSYTPGMDWMKFYPVKGRWWLYSLPFAIFMIIFDEFRKWHIRQYPKGFYKRETYY